MDTVISNHRRGSSGERDARGTREVYPRQSVIDKARCVVLQPTLLEPALGLPRKSVCRFEGLPSSAHANSRLAGVTVDRGSGGSLVALR